MSTLEHSSQTVYFILCTGEINFSRPVMQVCNRNQT